MNEIQHIDALHGKANLKNALFVPMDSYLVASKREAEAHHIQFVGSAGFLECLGVVMRIYAPDGAFQGAALAHATIANDMRTTITQMAEELKTLAPGGTIDVTIVGGERVHEFARPYHSSDSLRQEVLQAVSGYRVRDLSRDTDYSRNIVVDVQNGSIFSGIETKENNVFDIVDICISSYARGALKSFSDEVDALHQKVRNTGERLPAVKADWQGFLTDLRACLIASKQQISDDIGMNGATLQ
jgi:hypothetical protein